MRDGKPGAAIAIYQRSLLHEISLQERSISCELFLTSLLIRDILVLTSHRALLALNVAQMLTATFGSSGVVSRPRSSAG